MRDSLGNWVMVAWPEHHILYLKAAMSLPRHQRTAALQDIADMTGRSLSCVRTKAYAIYQAEIDARIVAECELRRQRDEAYQERRAARKAAMNALPSIIRQPTKQQLMGAR